MNYTRSFSLLMAMSQKMGGWDLSGFCQAVGWFCEAIAFPLCLYLIHERTSWLGYAFYTKLNQQVYFFICLPIPEIWD